MDLVLIDPHFWIFPTNPISQNGLFRRDFSLAGIVSLAPNQQRKKTTKNALFSVPNKLK